MALTKSAKRNWLGVAALAALTAVAYSGVKDNGFLNYDDNLYVSANGSVQAGLGWQSLKWAFTTYTTGNWIPVTWLSHMTDFQLYGLNPAGHHLTSVAIHAANAALLLVILIEMTGWFWPSFSVAALFAVHPINVESVAWIAERKSVLSTLFCFLAIWAYCRYVRRRGWARYGLVAGLFALALMSKPMAVTLPFVLLLLDIWPLGRLRPAWMSAGGQGDSARARAAAPVAGAELTAGEYSTGKLARPETGRAGPEPLKRIVIEKLPLLAMSALDSFVTMRAQVESQSVHNQYGGIWLRAGNAAISYVQYLEKALAPVNLAAFYPLPRTAPALWKPGLAVAVLLLLTVGLILKGRRRKYLSVCWLWYLGTLVPVIGLVQVGGQALADRYAYIPLVGIFIIVVWAIADSPRLRRPAAGAGVALGIAFTLMTRVQVGYWHDSISLFSHALGVTNDNYVACNNLGEALAGEGKIDDAGPYFIRAVEIEPRLASSQTNLGMYLVQKGKVDEGISHFVQAIQLDPNLDEAYNKLGAAFARKGNLDQAVPYLNKALAINPSNASAMANLGSIAEQQGRLDDAVKWFEESLGAVRGADLAVQLHFRLAGVFVKKSDNSRAADQYREVLRLRPDFEPAIEALKKLTASG